MDEQTIVSWRDVTAHCPVVASDGKDVGKVVEVAALPNEDIFHGIVFHHHVLGKKFLAPRDDVDHITEGGVYLSIDSDAVEKLGEFQEEHIERLGVVGIWRWKHMGWKDSSE